MKLQSAICSFLSIVAKSFVWNTPGKLISHIFRYLYHIYLEVMKVKIVHFHTYPLFRTIKLMLVVTHNLMRQRTSFNPDVLIGAPSVAVHSLSFSSCLVLGWHYFNKHEDLCLDHSLTLCLRHGSPGTAPFLIILLIHAQVDPINPRALCSFFCLFVYFKM